ncbi:MAG: hypothetical protein D6796_17350 [Caldilineae bacterium]|nr:MAG: hypothetical protein D6796_17350 [Caldilineae bacterium]
MELPDPRPAGGRPELRIAYDTLGRYFAWQVLNRHLSIAGAERRFGHKRTLHKRYTIALREFATGFYDELKRLRGETRE